MTRWQGLFADLDAYAESLTNAERAGEVGDLARAELSTTPFMARVAQSTGSAVRVRVAGQAFNGRLTAVGADSLTLSVDTGHEVVIPTRAIVAVEGASPRGAAEADTISMRLGFASALRGMSRDRSSVQLLLVDGSALGATIDRVGADFVEVAVHPAGEARRGRAVQSVRLVPFSALVAVVRVS